MFDDPWLDRWLPLVHQRAKGRDILELGCGTGRDTATLSRAGHRVVAIDLSSTSLMAARLRVPNAQFHCQDIQHPFPVAPGQAGAVVASLSLHYFAWADTLSVVQRIRQALQPSGLLLCRLNSTNDRHFGAVGHERLAENYYRVDGQPKRFFDRPAIDALFTAGWALLGVEETTIHRYALPKAVWEVALERAD